jgi:hypothetical protein
MAKIRKRLISDDVTEIDHQSVREMLRTNWSLLIRKAVEIPSARYSGASGVESRGSARYFHAISENAIMRARITSPGA